MARITATGLALGTKEDADAFLKIVYQILHSKKRGKEPDFWEGSCRYRLNNDAMIASIIF